MYTHPRRRKGEYGVPGAQLPAEMKDSLITDEHWAGETVNEHSEYVAICGSGQMAGRSGRTRLHADAARERICWQDSYTSSSGRSMLGRTKLKLRGYTFRLEV